MAEQALPPDDDVDDAEEVYLRRHFKLLLHRLERLPPAVRARVQGHFTQVLLDRTLTVDTPRGRLSFVALGRTGGGRPIGMLTKQPATIEWIDRFRPNSVFWDVGANVGVYTLYAALRGDTRVVALEPAAVNYFLLGANCEANRFDDAVQCLLAGLGSDTEIARLELSQFAAGMSFSFDGKRRRPYAGRQSALILTMDQLVEEYGLPCPNYVKIDVPGRTGAIIAGGTRTLRRPEVRELHVEAKDDSAGGRWIVERLRAHGFVLARKSVHGSSDLTFVREDDPALTV